jgi:hypothetical protein
MPGGLFYGGRELNVVHGTIVENREKASTLLS